MLLRIVIENHGVKKKVIITKMNSLGGDCFCQQG